MAGELFKSMSGVYLVHIPYQGSSGARTDVMGGQVDLMFDAVTTMAEQVKAGKVKALATTGLQRSSVLPDVPTVHEAGVPNYEATIWLGLMAPKGTPRGRGRPAQRSSHRRSPASPRCASNGASKARRRW